jgi:hypothetical protein
MTLKFPPEAVAEPVTVTLSLTATLRPASGHSFMGCAISLNAHSASGSAVTTFSQPYTITVEYEDEDVALVHEETLGLFQWDQVMGLWTDLESALDTEANELAATSDQVGSYAVVGETEQVFLPFVPAGD